MQDTNWKNAKSAITKSSTDANVYVGCDSIRYKSKKGITGICQPNSWVARYSVVIVLHHSRDGCNIYHQTFVLPDFGNIKERMLNEVNYAVSAALEIVDLLGPRTMSIHLDINPNEEHKSSVAVKEAIGWVRGMFGQDPVVKPDAWAASHVSDHVVRDKLV